MSMKTALPLAPGHLAHARSVDTIASSERMAAFIALTKPRIAVMVLFSVGVGFVLGARGSTHPQTLLLTLLGSGLVAAGASAWNQVIERDRDALMKRTARRPCPPAS